MDISGHMFMLVFCNLFIGAHVEEAKQKGVFEGVVGLVCKGVVCMFEVMMVCTILYWHTPAEKILGALAGVLGYSLIFKQIQSFMPSWGS